MVILCPYCKDDLRVEMTAQFVDCVDESILTKSSEEFERMQKRAASQRMWYVRRNNENNRWYGKKDAGSNVADGERDGRISTYDYDTEVYEL